MASITEMVPTTKLEAVNQLLRSVGERPVNDLTDTRRLDVVNAIDSINKEAKRLLLVGWWFNIEKGVTLTPNGNGELVLPNNALKFRLSRGTAYSSGLKLVERGRVLYDLDARSSTQFTDSVDIDVTYGLDYEELPESARQVIYYRAGIEYQGTSFRSVTLYQFSQQDARTAMAGFLDDASEFSEHNLFTSNYHGASAVSAHRR